MLPRIASPKIMFKASTTMLTVLTHQQQMRLLTTWTKPMPNAPLNVRDLLPTVGCDGSKRRPLIQPARFDEWWRSVRTKRTERGENYKSIRDCKLSKNWFLKLLEIHYDSQFASAECSVQFVDRISIQMNVMCRKLWVETLRDDLPACVCLEIAQAIEWVGNRSSICMFTKCSPPRFIFRRSRGHGDVTQACLHHQKSFLSELASVHRPIEHFFFFSSPLEAGICTPSKPFFSCLRAFACVGCGSTDS